MCGRHCTSNCQNFLGKLLEEEGEQLEVKRYKHTDLELGDLELVRILLEEEGEQLEVNRYKH